MIERNNVLELLGADKNKYHSCIITCYSFDFLFFEQRVLSRLRHAGILNVNIFVDSKIFQQQVNGLDSSHYTNKSYSITPVSLGSAFHPKIIMAFGKNNGFLAIGSGNLTNSGLSSNDEVWGAFHTYKSESPALELFCKSYDYLGKLKEYCFGINKIKWQWIDQNTSWINKSFNSNAVDEVVLDKNRTVRLLASFADISIYKIIIDSLPTTKLKSLTIISPYFNKTGEIITKLIQDLHPETIKVVVDSRFGTVPYQFRNINNVQFYDWINTSEIQLQTARLHAKIIQFQYESNSYILTGSANATTEALGTNSKLSKNAEMCLFTKSNIPRDWVQEMNINLADTGDFSLENYIPITIASNYESNSFICEIYRAEIEYSVLTIYATNLSKLKDPCSILLMKNDDSVLNLPVSSIKNDSFVSINLNEEDGKKGFKLYIIDEQGSKVSNTALVQFTQSIIKTNPDDKAARFLEIINSETLADNDLLELLEYANFDSPKPTYDSSKMNTVATAITNELSEREYATLDETEFNKNEEIIGRQHSHSNNHLTLLEDFLDHITFDSIISEDFKDSDERAAEEAKEDGINDEGLSIKEKDKLSFSQGESIKRKIHQTLNKIKSALKIKHEKIIESEISKNLTTIDDLKAALIGMHLIFMKINEEYIEERVRLKIKFSKLKEIDIFEKTKGFNINRENTQKGAGFDEILYSSDINIVAQIHEIMSPLENLRLEYIDETPSYIITHKFFKINTIFDKSSLVAVSLKGYLINVISPLLSIITDGVEKMTPIDLIKFDSYKIRLFNRVSILYLSLIWSRKEETINELFLLNLFNTLLPKTVEVTTVLNDIAVLREKLKVVVSENQTTITYYISKLKSFLEWRMQYNMDKKKLIKELERRDMGGIIYKRKYGFMAIQAINEKSLNCISPLGSFNQENTQFEVRNIPNGSKAIIY